MQKVFVSGFHTYPHIDQRETGIRAAVIGALLPYRDQLICAVAVSDRYRRFADTGGFFRDELEF